MSSSIAPKSISWTGLISVGQGSYLCLGADNTQSVAAAVSAEDFALNVRLIIYLYTSMASGVLSWFSGYKGSIHV